MLYVKYIHILGFTVSLKELRWKGFYCIISRKKGEYYSALVSSFNFGLEIIFHSQSLLPEAHVPIKSVFESHGFSETILPFKSTVQEYMDIMSIRIVICTMLLFSLEKQCLCTKCTYLWAHRSQSLYYSQSSFSMNWANCMCPGLQAVVSVNFCWYQLFNCLDVWKIGITPISTSPGT